MAIPASVRRIVEAQKAELERLSPSHEAELLAAALLVMGELEGRLKDLAPGRYTTQQVRVNLLQVRQIVDFMAARHGEAIGDAMQAMAVDVAAVSRQALIDQIGAWEGHFTGSVSRTAPVEIASGLLDPGLLERYEVSRARYGIRAIEKMRASMAVSTLLGETLSQAWERMAEAMELETWRAERIVRTEHSHVVHRRQIEDVRELYGEPSGEVPGWEKVLIASFDQRTGDDSKFVHLQRRPINKPFEDNEGRVYDHPPNRPNDREVMVLEPEGLSVLEPRP